MGCLNFVIYFIIIQNWNAQAYNGANVAGIPHCKASNCNLDTCHVDCDGLNLKLIPTLDMVPVNPGLITELTLRDNKIRQLPESGFVQFTNLRILELSRNQLEYCRNGSFMGLDLLTELYIRDISPYLGLLIFESGVFSPLTSIKILDVSSSSIEIPALFKAFCNLSKNIETILMDNICTNHILKNIDMPCFHRFKVKKISIDNSNIYLMASNFIFNIQSVEYLSLRQNRIDWHNNYKFLFILHNLTHIDVSCQYKFHCNNKYPWSKWLPTPKLFKENSTIVNTNTQLFSSNLWDNSKLYIYFLPNLQTVLLHDIYFFSLNTKLNKLNIDYSVPCWGNNRVINLDISFVNRVSAPDRVPCLKYLKYLNLRGIKTLTIGVKTFHDMPSLEVLMLGSSGIPEGTFAQPNFASFFAKNKELRFLDLSDLGLTSLQKNIFQNLNKLESLILSHNRLINIQEMKINLRSMQNIDLSNNKMRNIPLAMIANVFKNVKFSVLHLGNNPFICDCSDMCVLDEILHSKLRIPDFYELNGNLKCTVADNKNVPFMEAYDILRYECVTTAFTFIAVVYPLTICVFLIFVCCLRYRWKVKYVCYNLHLCVKGNKQNNIDSQFNFDAFVAHSGKDEEWVRTILIRTLENRNPSYTLCVHDRNFMPGEYITDNIISAINRSNKTILVISKTFVKSVWCDFESRMAQLYHLGKSNHRIIVIMFPGVYKYAIKKESLKTLLHTVTYLEWPKEQEKLRLFWLRLCNAFGRPLEIGRGNDYILQPI